MGDDLLPFAAPNWGVSMAWIPQQLQNLNDLPGYKRNCMALGSYRGVDWWHFHNLSYIFYHGLLSPCIYCWKNRFKDFRFIKACFRKVAFVRSGWVDSTRVEHGALWSAGATLLRRLCLGLASKLICWCHQPIIWGTNWQLIRTLYKIYKYVVPIIMVGWRFPQRRISCLKPSSCFQMPWGTQPFQKHALDLRLCQALQGVCAWLLALLFRTGSQSRSFGGRGYEEKHGEM